MKVNSLRIKTLMFRKLMTQAALAEASGVSKTTINNVILKGSGSVQTVGKIAKALDVEVDELVEV